MLDRRRVLSGTAALAAAPLLPAIAAPAAAAAHQGAAALNALFDTFVQDDLDLSPVTATALGLDVGKRAYQKRLLDQSSRAAIARQKALTASQLARLKSFDRKSVNGMDGVNYDVTLFEASTSDAADRRYDYGAQSAGQPYVISQLSGNYQNTPAFLDTQHTIETRADAQAYLARLSAFAVTLDQEIDVARHDAAQGVVPPDFALTKTLIQMRALRADAPEKSNLTQSLVRRTADRKIAGDWGNQAARLVKDKIYPALDRQIALVEAMRKHATHDAGVWKLPRGEEYYHDSLTYWCTTDMRPDAIHRSGLEIVKSHTAQIDALMKAQGMTRGTVGMRLRAMFTDPRFLFANTDAAKDKIIVALNEKVKAVQAQLPKWFHTLPRTGLRIMRVPKYKEAAEAGGYYDIGSLDGKRPGTYWINLRDTAEVPSWFLPTLTYHEGIPGHHLQLTLQNEAKLPVLRKMMGFSAYEEGWALYAEQLAVEMGLYDHDPIGHIGQLHDSMFRGVRMVVDSGMHALRWSREKAVKYYTDTLGDPESGAITEIERYCVWPGQACSYMLGKLEFLKQRDRAKTALGARFDIRAFHDAMLLSAAMPLSLMAGVTDRYIAAAKG